MNRSLPVRWRLRAVAAATVIPPLLSVTSFTRVASWLGGEPDAAPAKADGLDDTSLARWVDGLLRRLWGPWRHTCLKRAAVLYHLLRRAGRPVELCIGVRRDGGGALAAHAWLVRDGVPYLEREPAAAQAHTIIARFPEGAAS